jgi:hypothetical protein
VYKYLSIHTGTGHINPLQYHLQVPQETVTDLGVKEINGMPAHLVEDESEVGKLVEDPGDGLTETISEHSIEAGIDIGQEGVVEHASAMAIQEINNLTGVDIITLQPSQVRIRVVEIFI